MLKEKQSSKPEGVTFFQSLNVIHSFVSRKYIFFLKANRDRMVEISLFRLIRAVLHWASTPCYSFYDAACISQYWDQSN